MFILLSNLLSQGEDGARMNSLTTELVETLFDDVTTVHEAFMRGVRLSGRRIKLYKFAILPLSQWF